MQIISVLNEKGGVGKTTISLHLAAWLAMQPGIRVLLVDADPQANATAQLGLREEPGLYDLLIRDAEFRTVTRQPKHETWFADGGELGGNGSLFAIPSNVESRAIPQMLPEPKIVRERFGELAGTIDYVIFDTPPTPTLFHTSIYLATDAVIYTTTCDPQSVQGLRKSMGRLDAASNYRKAEGLTPILPLAIVPTIYRETKLHQTNLQVLREEYGKLVINPVAQRIAWSEAAQLSKTVYAYAPGSDADRDARRMADQIMAVDHAR